MNMILSNEKRDYDSFLKHLKELNLNHFFIYMKKIGKKKYKE